MKANNQLEIEQQNLDIVINSSLNNISKAKQSKTISDLKQSRSIVPYYVDELETKLRTYTAEIMLGAAKVKPVPAKIMTLLPPIKVSHYTVKTVMNQVGSKIDSVTSMYQQIAKQLLLEYDMLLLEQQSPKDYDKMVNYIESSSYNGARKQKLTGDLLQKYHKDLISKNMQHSMMQLAQVAITLLSECQPIISGVVTPPLIYMATIPAGPNRSKVKLVAAPWVLEWMRDQVSSGNLVPAYNTALIERPKDWVGMTLGGFHMERNKNNFVKTQVDRAKLPWDKMKRTVQAVNNLQRTAWEINTDILPVLDYALKNRKSWGDIAAPTEIAKTPHPFPDVPRDSLNEAQKLIVKTWASQMAALYDEYHAEVSRFMAVNRCVNEAKRFSQYSELFFAYQVDFRGRVYPIASNLHPQGPSFAKALLRFANGKKIETPMAEKYLAMQGANTYGQDKIRLDEKLEWVLKHEQEIFASARGPIEQEFWKNADSPWEFLAWCFEWTAYRNDPSTFKSKMAVAMDGSCNGLQHLSAMLRDEIGGSAVNLTANKDKRDIYSVVKDRTIEQLKKEDNPIAAKVLQFGIERSTCKRSVMIMPYAGTLSACREYVQQDFIERGAKGFFGPDLKEAVIYTSNMIWSQIGSVVIKGREIMSWFKKNARLAAKYTEDHDLTWTTPNGFTVVQRRVKQEEVRYQTALGEHIQSRISMRLLVDTNEPDYSGHGSSVCPNFIHSLDACALQETVNMCVELGITDFSMIHDSYGTHAANSDIMARTLREAFVMIYEENDVILNWILEQPKDAQAKFTEVPSSGNLNLREVLDSEHFFA